MAAELIGDLGRIYQRKKAANEELKELVAETGATLMDLHGIGPSGAARLLVEVGDITRFPDRGHFASWNGTAPIDASFGDQVRHRLSRAGNRQINRVLHMMATVQLRNPTQGVPTTTGRRPTARHQWKLCHASKRRRSDIVYRRMLNDAITHTVTGREGNGERLLTPARPAHTPTPALRKSHFPDPPTCRLRRYLPLARPLLRPVPDALSQRRPAAEVKRGLLDDG